MRTITLDDLKGIYGMPIKREAYITVTKYIQEKEVQNLISKAMKCEITRSDRNYIMKLNDTIYPRIYWLLNIYINPITKIQSISRALRILQKR